MGETQSVRQVQMKILEIMKYIDKLCRDNGIVYYIMSGTALGAVRHGGFIPWDDDLDIFMTPDQYQKFKQIFNRENSDKYVIQEWKTTEKYVEYAKVRMNGTTFIEKAYKDRKDLHQGIYVDIMMLHKVPENRFIQRLVYVESKFVTLYGLSMRNWKPKTRTQALVLKSLKIMPCKTMANIAYRRIYRYDQLQDGYRYGYWITYGTFKNGLYDSDYFADPVDTPFEDTMLLGPSKVNEYLHDRFGDYMKLPPEEKRKEKVHAMMYDTEKDYSEYL